MGALVRQGRRAPKRQTALSGLCVIAIAALLSATGTNMASAQQSPTITIDSGVVEGVRLEHVERFLGIPYAEPPVGELRWRAPRPARSWDGVRRASEFGDDCVQNRPFWDRTQSQRPSSEDCLTLSVWRPADSVGGPLPVMVWIHGGGFVMGSSSQSALDGGAIASRGVVVVSFNYRLGRFGFFAHPALSAAQTDEPLGNYGFMDQLAALRWVQRNIAAFGGDPSNVTIFGQSAGGTSVLQLMVMEDARGLFHRAIAQSSAGRDDWPRLAASTRRPGAEAIGERFAREAGLRDATPEALRALSADEIRGRLDLVNTEEDTFSGPIVDGRLINGSAADGFAAGRQARIPLMIGFTSNELGALPGILRNPLANRFAERLGLERRAIETLYGGRSAFRRGFVSDFPFAEPARHIAQLSAASGAPTFLYVFDYVGEAARARADGASHTSDVPYLFASMDQIWEGVSAADRAQSDLIIDHWTAFARSGDPNVDGRVRWNAYANDSVAHWFGNAGPVERPLNTRVLDAIEAAHSEQQR